MFKKAVSFIIYFLLLFGVYGAGKLSYNEIMYQNICPKIIGIPACFIIFLCFLIPLIVHFLRKKNTLYFLFTGIAFLIAMIGTIGQMTNKIQCPKNDNGIPMCFISLGIFITLILLKIFLIRKEQSKIL
jgi:hypothetical protein